MIKAANLKLVVETNGVLLTPALAEAVAGCRSPFISVSLDGAEAETHEWVRGVPGSYKAALQGITYLVRAGLKPQIIFSIMRRNRNQVEDIVRLAKELGAGSVKFNIIQGSPRADLLQTDNETLTLTELLDLGRWVERELSPRVDLPLLFHHPLAFRPLSLIFASNGLGGGRCGIQNIIGVLANGSFALCGIGENIPELVFGHAARDRLSDVWLNHPVLCDIREGLPDRLTGICRDCLMNERCLGFCLAQNYYRSKDLWAPYWFCQQADDAGLFPANRRRPPMVKSDQISGGGQENLALRA
jgi:SynChlorMet cassette radical SAM/SPASM protein ScmF